MIGAFGINLNFNPGDPYADKPYGIDYYPISDRLISKQFEVACAAMWCIQMKTDGGLLC